MSSLLTYCFDLLAVRLYDIETLQCFVCSYKNDQHTRTINMVSEIIYYLMSEWVWLGIEGSAADTWYIIYSHVIHTHMSSLVSDIQVKYSPNANMYVSCSDDGDIKIWDGVSNRCVNTFSKAHGDKPVSSVVFSRNSKVI